MRIRTAEPADAASLIELWTAAGLKFRPGQVPAELAAVLARDPDLVLIAEDAGGVTAAVLGTFDGRRGWVKRLATHPGRRGQGHASAVLAELERMRPASGPAAAGSGEGLDLSFQASAAPRCCLIRSAAE